MKLQVLQIAFILLLIAAINKQSPAQENKKAYTGQGAVSEIIMASPAEIVSHFDMFFSAKIPTEGPGKEIYWYKIVFNRDCYFDLTLFPLSEDDRYTFAAFKVQTNMNFCEAKANQKVTSFGDSLRITPKFHDHDQSEKFRSNLVVTKKTPVKAGEAIYLAVKSIWGQDFGHIIGFNTCDYSYVLEVQKIKSPKKDSLQKQQTIMRELQEEEALAAIGQKLCPPDNKPVNLGTIAFSKQVSVVNQPYFNGEAEAHKTQPVKVKPVELNLPEKIKSHDIYAIKTDTIQQLTIKPKPIYLNTIPPIPAPENKLVPVRCMVIDAIKSINIDNQPIITDELTGKNIPIKRHKQGEYEVAIEKGKNYKIECNALGYRNFDHSINIYKSLKGEENVLEIPLQPLVAGENFILKNIYFNANTPVIKSESNKELEKLYTFMKNNPDAVISIEGHTNSNRYIGKDKRRSQMGGKWAFHGTAKKLSRYRADEVKAYLIRRGIDNSRVKTKGWGGDHELYPNARTVEESSKNMRVEVVIVKI